MRVSGRLRTGSELARVPTIGFTAVGSGNPPLRYDRASDAGVGAESAVPCCFIGRAGAGLLAHTGMNRGSAGATTKAWGSLGVAPKPGC